MPDVGEHGPALDSRYRQSDYAGRWRNFIVNSAARMGLNADNTGDFNALIDSLALSVREKNQRAADAAAKQRAAQETQQNLAAWVANEKADIAAKLNDLRQQLVGEINAKHDSLAPFVARGEISGSSANAQLKSMIDSAKATYSNTAQSLVNDAKARFEQMKAS